MSGKRLIFLDTETTGTTDIDPSGKIYDRVIEIGAVEMIDRKLTGREFHVYIYNDTRLVHEEAEAVHGLNMDDIKRLSKGKKFEHIMGDMLEFIGDDEVVAHNADFDRKFLDAELINAGVPGFSDRQHPFSCTLNLANKIIPSGRKSLDALCDRFGIDRSQREKEGHGALVDTKLLAQVYLAMTTNQMSLINNKSNKPKVKLASKFNIDRIPEEKAKKLSVISVNETEKEKHNKFVERIKKESGDNLSTFTI